MSEHEYADALDEVYDTGANGVEEDPEFASMPEALQKYVKDGEWRDGVRPANIITCEDDIDRLQDAMRLSGTQLAFVLCRYCGTKGRIRQTGGSKWFYDHPCKWQQSEPIGEWLKRNGLTEEAA